MGITYRGLTHVCDDPDCHVPGFVASVQRLDAEQDAPRVIAGPVETPPEVSADGQP